MSESEEEASYGGEDYGSEKESPEKKPIAEDEKPESSDSEAEREKAMKRNHPNQQPSQDKVAKSLVKMIMRE
jgi:hypothetical protein